MKVFIVEDSENIRGYLQSMLSGIPGVMVTGYAANELEAIKLIDELLPDVVTLDIHLQSGSGITVLDYIKKHHDAIKVIVLTNYTDEFYANKCIHAGADYVFDKTSQFSLVRPVLWSWIHADYAGDKAATLQRAI